MGTIIVKLFSIFLSIQIAAAVPVINSGNHTSNNIVPTTSQYTNKFSVQLYNNTYLMGPSGQINVTSKWVRVDSVVERVLSFELQNDRCIQFCKVNSWKCADPMTYHNYSNEIAPGFKSIRACPSVMLYSGVNYSGNIQEVVFSTMWKNIPVNLSQISSIALSPNICIQLCDLWDWKCNNRTTAHTTYNTNISDMTGKAYKAIREVTCP